MLSQCALQLVASELLPHGLCMLEADDSSIDLSESLRILDGLCLAYSKESLAYFLNCIVIPGESRKTFGEAADPWQRELLAPMIAAFENLAGLSNEPYTGRSSFMHILARGHSKSSLEAWIIVWLLLASRRPIKAFVLAADTDQGRIIIQSAEDTIKLNPWLGQYITINKNKISGPGGWATVLSSDVGSMYGLQGNLYICDEIVHWPSQAPWTSVYTGRRKVKPNVFVVMSNAGVLDSWQHKVYERAKADPNWVVFHRPGSIASWLNQADIERDRLLLPPSEADRLYGNRWIDASEEYDYLRRPEVEQCESIGRALKLIYRLRPPAAGNTGNYIAGIDYGPKRDRTALSVVHQSPDGVVILDRLDVWSRTSGRNVQVSDVEAWIKEVNIAFRPRTFVADEYQMESTIQWMERSGIPVERFAFRAGHGNHALAMSLRMLVADKRLVWYPGAGRIAEGDDLTSELIGLRVKRMPYGFRFDHEAQKHDDRAFAVGIAATRALEHPAMVITRRPVEAPARAPHPEPFAR